MVSISKSGVHRILIENLDTRKLYAIWLPRLLAMEQKQRREDVSIECLAKFPINKVIFFSRFITINKTWVHYFIPKTNNNQTMD